MPFASIRPLLRLVAAVVLALLLLDAALFRSGLYARLLKPESTAGSVVGATRAIAHYRDAQRKNVLVLGNSQVAEGFSAALADAAAARPDLHFVNGAVPGTDLRVWNYLLRAVDPKANRFAAVVLMIDGNLDDNGTDLTNNPLDTRYLAPLLRLRDTFDYPATFSDPTERAIARRAILLPLQAFREDLRGLLAAPRQRYRALRIDVPGWIDAVGHYAGHESRLPDLPFDAGAELPRDWGDMPAAQRQDLERYFHGVRATAPPDLRAANDAYEREWLGRIAARYAARGGRVIVFVVPRGPWHAQLARPPHYVRAQTELIASGRVRALPADAFVELEQPQYFFDTLHMNRAGRERFSPELARRVAAEVP